MNGLWIGERNQRFVSVTHVIFCGFFGRFYVFWRFGFQILCCCWLKCSSQEKLEPMQPTWSLFGEHALEKQCHINVWWSCFTHYHHCNMHRIIFNGPHILFFTSLWRHLLFFPLSPHLTISVWSKPDFVNSPMETFFFPLFRFVLGLHYMKSVSFVIHMQQPV